LSYLLLQFLHSDVEPLNHQNPMPILIRSATQIRAAGNKPKIIEEFFGRVNSGTNDVSIAHMRSPAGWIEPGQTPEFDEYTVVLHGVVRVDSHGGAIDVHSGQAVVTRAGEWVQYSSPYEEGADYISVCLPAFDPDTVHRDETG
jgi:mannose-6-phosphate isomerase-like protein (cupin superfamily)